MEPISILVSRILSRTNTNGPVSEYAPQLGRCWIFPGATINGYGNVGIRIDKVFKSYLTHIVVYEALRKPVFPGLVLDHLCRVRNCCNPWHLEEVTLSENIRRGAAPNGILFQGANHNAQKTHCQAGHEYTPENTEIEKHKDGRTSRKCKTCRRKRDREYRARKQEQKSINFHQG